MTKSPVKSFRLNPDLIKELEKEAKEQHRTLSNYIEYLLINRNKGHLVRPDGSIKTKKR